jgi:hypothetical protein
MPDPTRFLDDSGDGADETAQAAAAMWATRSHGLNLPGTMPGAIRFTGDSGDGDGGGRGGGSSVRSPRLLRQDRGDHARNN